MSSVAKAELTELTWRSQFGGAVLALIIVGEINFWSDPVKNQTDPIANISQWSNIVGAVLTACGSLYLLLAKYLKTAEREATMPYLTADAPCHCNCHHHDGHDSLRHDSLSDNLHPDMVEIPRSPLSDRAVTDPPFHSPLARADTTPVHPSGPLRIDTFPDDPSARLGLGIHTLDSNASTTPTTTTNKNDVTRALMKLANSFGNPSEDRFNDNKFRHGKATGFPTIPGEDNRNRMLNQIKQQWGELTDEDEIAGAAGAGLTPRGRRSRANSFNSVYRSPSAARTPSPHPPTRSQTAGPVAAPAYLGLPRTHSPESTSESIFPSRPSAEMDPPRSPIGEGRWEGRAPEHQPKSQGTMVTLHEGTLAEGGPVSPAIVLVVEEEAVVEEPEGVDVMGEMVMGEVVVMQSVEVRQGGGVRRSEGGLQLAVPVQTTPPPTGYSPTAQLPATPPPAASQLAAPPPATPPPATPPPATPPPATPPPATPPLAGPLTATPPPATPPAGPSTATPAPAGKNNNPP